MPTAHNNTVKAERLKKAHADTTRHMKIADVTVTSSAAAGVSSPMQLEIQPGTASLPPMDPAGAAPTHTCGGDDMAAVLGPVGHGDAAQSNPAPHRWLRMLLLRLHQCLFSRSRPAVSRRPSAQCNWKLQFVSQSTELAEIKGKLHLLVTFS